MFDLNGITVNTIELLDPLVVTGAEYFNYFFTMIAMVALVCFGINALVRIVTRS